MIIPIRCFTCNANLSSKYAQYKQITENKTPEIITNDNIDEIKKENKMTKHEYAFILLNLNRYCCRRHMLSQVDIINKI